MGLVEAGKITLKEAAEKIGRSYRKAPYQSDCKGNPAKDSAIIPTPLCRDQ